MDVVLTSCRALPDSPAEPHWSRLAAAATAAALATAPGVQRIRWLCPHTGEEGPPPDPTPAGALVPVECLPVEGEVPPFGGVQERLYDFPADHELTAQMRDPLPDLVHCFGMGSPGSSALPWIAERMGRAAITSVVAAEVLCHRLDLVPFDGPGPCATWSDPERCLACCGEAPQAPPRGAKPRLTALGFQNRFELSVGGLLSARSVLVADEADRVRLVEAGLGEGRLEVVGDLLVPDLGRYGLPV